MSTSDSDLSSPPATDDEMSAQPLPAKARKTTQQKKKKNGLIISYFNKKERSPSPPPRKKRAPSPPHEPVAEDNFDIAFIVIFRSRFSEAFPSKCPHVGPQDLERGVASDVPSPEVESLLCALLGLVNNRKKPVEKGQYGRALEEAVQTQKHQWPTAWNYQNPLHGGRSFNTMAATERLGLLKALVLWSLNHSTVVKDMINNAYKSRSIKDRADTNIPLSVQPWGKDGDKRRYWLIQGQDDTPFRVYRESNPSLKHVTWWSVAGSIEELQALAKKLEEEDGHREAKALAERITAAIPRFEATEEKRKKRAYRQERKAKLERPNPFPYGLYEGRTRGKRTRYNYSDGEEEDSEAGVRRSTRNSGRESSAAPTGPTVTASGRQVRSRATGMYGESLLSGQTTDRASPATGDYVRSDASEEPERPAHGRSTRAANRGTGVPQPKKRNFEAYNEEMTDEEDATSWNGDDEDEDEPEPEHMDVDDDEEEESAPESDAEDKPQHLIVRLKFQNRQSLGSLGSSPPPLPQNGVQTTGEESQPAPVTTGPPTGMDAARQQPIPAVAPAPAATAAPLAQPLPPPTSLVASLPPQAHLPPAEDFDALPPVPSGAQPNGVHPQPVEPVAVPPVAPAAQLPPAPAALATDAHTLPPLGSLFRAPTPPYGAQEAPKPDVQAGFPVAKHEVSHEAQAYPAPAPAANWQ